MREIRHLHLQLSVGFAAGKNNCQEQAQLRATLRPIQWHRIADKYLACNPMGKQPTSAEWPSLIMANIHPKFGHIWLPLLSAFCARS
jgi:hypothetical protein